MFMCHCRKKGFFYFCRIKGNNQTIAMLYAMLWDVVIVMECKNIFSLRFDMKLILLAKSIWYKKWFMCQCVWCDIEFQSAHFIPRISERQLKLWHFIAMITKRHPAAAKVQLNVPQSNSIYDIVSRVLLIVILWLATNCSDVRAILYTHYISLHFTQRCCCCSLRCYRQFTY